MKKYKDLNALLADDEQAAKMFRQLPQYAKDQIMERGRNVNSRVGLEGYIEKVTRGDD